MKFPFGKKDAAQAPKAPPPAPVKAAVKPKAAALKPARVSDGKKQIISGLVFISASFLGAVFLLYLTVNAQSAKESELKDMNQKLLLVSTEKDAADFKAKDLQTRVGRVLDLEKVVKASEKVHDEKEIDRKEGALWIDRKTGNCMVTLGVLNGINKGSRLGVYEGDNMIATLKVTSSLDVVSYAEPVDKKIAELTRDYYQIKAQ